MSAEDRPLALPGDDAAPGEEHHPGPAVSRLAVFKALGDNTRYAIYLELARARRPLATAEIAEQLGLHVNTVRPHLERMREAGLLELFIDARGGVGRPQHRYAPSASAPALGLEPAVFPLLARMLVRLASDAGLGGGEALDVGRSQGRADAAGAAVGSCAEALGRYLAELGFDPASAADDEVATIAFLHCPFRELAEANPDLVCSLHQGMVEGFVAGCADSEAEVVGFRSLADRDPCQVDLRCR
ncbi:MAG: helix-turn-helix transcriptional regulator [Acidimicrobiales bacterium]